MVNLKIEGLPEEIVNELVHKRIASNKSEAIRLMILDYNEHHGIKKISQYIQESFQDEKSEWLAASQKSLEKVWDNKKDDEVWSKY